MKLEKIIRKAQTEINPATGRPYLPSPDSSTVSMPDSPKKPVCPDCGGAGWWRYEVPGDHPEFGKLHKCHCQAENEAIRLQKISGLSELELTYSLDDILLDKSRPGTAEMVKACRNFVRTPVYMLTLWGTWGNAKSVAMVGVVNALLEKKIESVYVVAFDLINYIRKAFSEGSHEVRDDDAYSRLQKFERVPVLAIDELDKIFPLTAWEAKQLTELIDHRYRYGISRQRGTILTMNKDPQILFDGDLYHIYSRLADKRNVIQANTDSDLRPHMRGTHE